MVRKILLVVSLIFVILLFVGCQTVQGIGKDITWIGQAGENVMGGS